MSFKFNWTDFSPDFIQHASGILQSALNNRGHSAAKGGSAGSGGGGLIAGLIEVDELVMGSMAADSRQPPELEMLEIGEMTTDKFRGIFRLVYDGDARIVLKTSVQANPLNHNPREPSILDTSAMLAAQQPLIVPMHLSLSAFKLRAIVVLVISKAKGVTLVFKNDPLHNVDVSSTFDSIAAIQGFIQAEIERQLRDLFREDLPAIIYKMSQGWLAKLNKYSSSGSETHLELPYKAQGQSQAQAHAEDGTIRDLGISIQQPSPSPSTVRMRQISASKRTGLSPNTSIDSDSNSPPKSSLPDLENYDPTYGLRSPERSLSFRSDYTSLGKMWKTPRGLAGLPNLNSLAEDLDGLDMMEDEFEFDNVDEEGSNDRPASSRSSSYSSVSNARKTRSEHGRVPARPKIYHSQSMIQSPILLNGDSFPSPGLEWKRDEANRAISPLESAPDQEERRSPSEGSEYSSFPAFPFPRMRSLSSSVKAFGQSLQRGIQSAPVTPGFSNFPNHNAVKQLQSTSEVTFQSSTMNLGPSLPSSSNTVPKRAFSASNVLLSPHGNSSVSNLAMLSHLHHTLSPYTRYVDNVLSRSSTMEFQNKNGSAPGSAGGSGTQRGRRRRMYHLNGRGTASVPSSPAATQHEFAAGSRFPSLTLSDNARHETIIE